MKLWAMPCRDIQDGLVMVESSDKAWSTRERNGKPLKYSCLEKLINSMKRQKYGSDFPFPFPVGHILSELSTMTRPSWVALHGMTHSFIELDKVVVPVIRLVSFCWLVIVVFSLSAL